MKALKIVLIVLVVGGVVLLFTVMGNRSANYWNYTQTGGEIEARYTALGSSEVSYAEYDAKDETIGKYAVWCPDDLKSNGSKYPVVIFANGTGSTFATYKAFLEHLSLWGFIAVGNDDKNTRAGASLEAAIEFLIDDKNGIAQGICPLWSLQENYSLLPETVDKVIARKKNTDHGDSYLQFDGYMTAWFM